MQSRLTRYSSFLLAVVFLVSICVIDADAQRRRRRRARRVPRPVVTNPAIAEPGSEQDPGDTERIISTADQNSTETDQTESPSTRRGNAGKKSSGQDMQQTINALSNQVNKLNDKLTQMQENDRSLIDIERLTRAEQRAESLRLQQVDVESKLADLQARTDQVDYALRPENIERAAAYGTTHPEEAREQRRQQLLNEKVRLQAQIRILETSRSRLEASVATADGEVDLLRRRLETNRQQESAGSAPTEPRAPDTETPPQ